MSKLSASSHQTRLPPQVLQRLNAALRKQQGTRFGWTCLLIAIATVVFTAGLGS